MADYPAQPARRVTLRDGREVTVRPVRRDDDLMESDFIRRLSGETRFLRFQKWVHAPSDRLIHFLTDVDFDRHYALLATFARGGEQEIVGEARYVRLPDGETCELGIVVADDWRKSGLAGVLMEALLRAARERGLKRMEGQVIASNLSMRRFMAALGFRIEIIEEDRSMVRIVKDL
jgi:acetyltransferase